MNPVGRIFIVIAVPSHQGASTVCVCGGAISCIVLKGGSCTVVSNLILRPKGPVITLKAIREILSLEMK